MGRRPSFLKLFTALILAAAFSRGAAADAAPVPKDEKPRPGIPVTLDGEELFSVRGRFGPFSPEERASAGTRRLERLANDPFYSPDLITIKEEGGSALILYRGETVGVVLPADAAADKIPPAELAAQRVRVLQRSIERYRARRLPVQRTRGALALAALSILLAALLKCLEKAYALLAARLRTFSARLEHLRRRYQVSEESLVSGLGRALELLRAALTVALLIAYLESAFSFMPLTRGYALSVLGYIFAPLRTLAAGFWSHVGDYFFILVVSLLTRYALRALRWLMTGPGSADRLPLEIEPEWALPLYKILRLAVLAFAAVIIYPYIPGSNTEAFKGIGLFVGALFTLGSSGTVNNIVGGLSLMFMKSFRLGDHVRIGDVLGDVVETDFLVTRLRTPKNEIVTFPNSKVLTGHLVNYSAMARQDGLTLHTPVTIGYDVPWRKVHELLLSAGRKTGGVEPSPAPFVLQKALNDSYVTYEINVFTKQASAMNRIYGELHQNIQDAFNEAGVEILSPAYSALRDGNTTTNPPSYRPPSYRPPSFRINGDNE